MRSRARLTRLAALGALGAALAGCGTDRPAVSTASIDLTIEVCDMPTCFTTPVPGATVTVTLGGRDTVLTTDEHGVARFSTPESGIGQVTATWAGLHAGPATLQLDPGGMTDVSMGFTDLATVAEPAG